MTRWHGQGRRLALLVVALAGDVEGEPPTVAARIWRRLRTVVEPGSGADDVLAWARARFGAHFAEAVGRRLDGMDRVARRLEQYEDLGVFVVTELDPEYPGRWRARLGERRPAVLYCMGERTVLRGGSIGVVGSREVDEDGRRFARAVAGEAVSQGRVVVSGGARGIDLEAMRAAMEHGGGTIGFLADSLLDVARRPAMQAFLGRARACLATPFPPSAGFSVATAMARNRLIYAHSLATVVVASASGVGGTWSGATEALRRRLCPVLVRMGPGVPEGNERLVAAGAVPIGAPREIRAHLRTEEPLVEQGLLF